ncbi:UDP-N-acetylmuramoyl-tripeptide--D-alanyl-D-alanine ligase [Listeria newyorkensis]|uniref:UDP-N-acetylmuramoyl-tripeptide--D-alanyl-D-alanine ligase n=1 Tax=Listeria newyorkensis TaxID=1497681 RepID=A0ABX4XXD4_9LIST|nr:UDP-N-acetylmuramoyl-tripeptide--D-alanyl-D-alanine ligase [Listeria newyorkensis]KGL44048.1 UDP-N-acetylmuramoyl-tripeptide--D-alanyl-D-alanine ligase [Listeria newyorkensis]KMT61510.1 UDP-N-acetylmuramoyl-tripeptide--D-alanyl-D- alanine ligase [Listeria newyorkensis]PNP94824.1 UDP-N-acetylmuramoyl-tripeptide--D-alanyl-D-alanine ligase [Listeria newyorkensis]WAO21775.1 UDP-N-acetylmuramoyl-tripeptide--D-alanyl-D-alanine ligase [Listeria newyorkensis]SQC57387.1 UDP-N-acetylmuramoyl-tripepti
MKKTVAEMAEMISVFNDVEAWRDVVLTGVCFDTRQIQAGDLFVPFVGESRDGHAFVKDAYDAGASAALWQKDVPNPPAGVPVLMVEDTLTALQDLAKAYLKEVHPKTIAITGSNGKTTTKDIMAAIVASKYRVHKTGGNFNNHIGLPYTILSMPADTEVAVLEMGMNHRREIEVLTKIVMPDIALITNIGEAHLEHLGSREEIAKAKMEIAMGLDASSLLIYPSEEELLKPLVTDNYRVATFGENGDLRPEMMRTEMEGTSFTTNAAPDVEIFVPIVGEHNVFNTMAAMLAAQELGISASDVKEALANMERSNSRLEWLVGAKGSDILNDAYNSSPTALMAVLKTFMHLEAPSKKKFVVVADMLELGADADTFHYNAGKSIGKGSIDKVFAYGNHIEAFTKAAAEQIGEENVFYFETKAALEAELLAQVTGEEYIMVKGSYGMGLKDIVEALMSETI